MSGARNRNSLGPNINNINNGNNDNNAIIWTIIAGNDSELDN